MPVTEAAVSTTLKLAAGKIADYLKSAEERKKDNMHALDRYVLAARDAIIALEAEYEQILVDAEFCDLNSPNDVKNLQVRITSYLEVDCVSPLLDSSALGLRRTRNRLQIDAEGFFNEWWNPDRLPAVLQLSRAIERLEEAIYKLKNLAPGHRSDGRSGVGMHHLVRLLEELEEYQRNPRDAESGALEKLVKEFRKDRGKDFLTRHKEEIEKAYFDVLDAF